MGNIKERAGFVYQPTKLSSDNRVIVKWKITKKEINDILETPISNRLQKINSIQRKKKITIN